jgi:hypothetical protein
MPVDSGDTKYLDLILGPVRVCGQYKPKFGQGPKNSGLSLEQFQKLYKDDLFYHWFGLDNPMMYAAHKAAGGMTSIYRQIGIGCEKLFRKILMDSFCLNENDVIWSYDTSTSRNIKARTLHLDGLLLLEKISDENKRKIFFNWMKNVSTELEVNNNIISALTGTVFEVRQGYKTKDSKRQNADIANAGAAYRKALLPCAVILSAQIDTDILHRYRTEGWVVLTGIENTGDPNVSTYAFMKHVLGYDLAAFFQRNSMALRAEIDSVLKALLAPEAP